MYDGTAIAEVLVLVRERGCIEAGTSALKSNTTGIQKIRNSSANILFLKLSLESGVKISRTEQSATVLVKT